MITSLTVPYRYAAAELAALCARSWEIELVFDKIKTRQRGRPVLRSQTPDGVRREIYAYLIVCQPPATCFTKSPSCTAVRQSGPRSPGTCISSAAR
ncbi:hypothetical protein [Streptomyces sp. NPDC101149]|uniref:hypothetical protein n=1 Tax=Streptomyces sp. NPDC101149 TaxID=3366113 RepID=UPI0037F9D241